jgi:hypothetical protein
MGLESSTSSQFATALLGKLIGTILQPKPVPFIKSDDEHQNGNHNL